MSLLDAIPMPVYTCTLLFPLVVWDEIELIFGRKSEMKNQELHDLKTGELERFVQHIIPFLKEHRTKFYVAAGTLFLLIAGYAYFSTREPADSGVWKDLYAAVHSNTAEAKQKYEKIVDNSPETTAGMWAELRLADATLNTGLTKIYTDSVGAKKDIKRAAEMYNKLINTSSISDDILERTLYGLARVAEIHSDGNTEGAIKEYKRLMEQFPKSIYIPLIKNKIKSLEKDSTKQFYTWFSQKKPTLQDSQKILDAIGSPTTSSKSAGDSSTKFDLDSKSPNTPKKELENKKKEADLNPFEKETPEGKLPEKKTAEAKEENNPFKEKKNSKKEIQTKEKVEPKQDVKKKSPSEVPPVKEEKK